MRLGGTLGVKSRSMPVGEREAIIGLLSTILEARGDVVFTVVFGGFLERPVFHDLDLGVYLRDFKGDAIDAAVYAENLSAELTKQVGVPVDVVMLNYAPMWLRLRALKGRVIVDKDPLLRLALKLAAIDNSIASFYDERARL